MIHDTSKLKSQKDIATREVQYPDLSKESVLSIDIETKDPNLKTYGPGVFRKDGHILGVSVATKTGFTEYYNLGHYDCSPETKEKNLAYITELMGLDVPKLGVNLMYDIDWLTNFQGITVNGRYHDIQVAEPLIEPFGFSVSLDNLGKKYFGIGKFKTQIDKFCEDNDLKGDPRAWLWKMPYQLVRDYAIEDVVLPLKIFDKQYNLMKQQNLLSLYALEMKLYRPLLAMRKTGARVDIGYIEKMKVELADKIEKLDDEIIDEAGFNINTNSTKQLARFLDDLGIAYEYKAPTDLMRKKGITQGNPSITNPFMEKIQHPTIQKIVDHRKSKKVLSTFFVNSFTDSRIDDRIHTSFFPLKNDQNGAITGRFSSAKPNLQQIPARDKVIGPMCRKAFIPNEGKLWFKLDWSQIEYRIIAHFAQGPGAAEIREKYSNDPKTDYHKFVMDLTGLDRKPAKSMNFGVAYCMGQTAAAKNFGWSAEYTSEVYDVYHKNVPFLKHTLTNVISKAEREGFITTILGRRARVEKGKSYKVFNALIQGSAADIMKQAMVSAYEEGLFDKLDFSLTVHDEFDGSMPKTKEGLKALFRLKEIMETCVPLRVPVIADLEIGKNWQEVTEYTNIEEAREVLK